MDLLAHGTLTFKFEDNILLIEGVGPWNKEALSLSLKDSQLLARNGNVERWGVIAIMHGDPIHTLDAEKLLIDIVIKDKCNGRVASALMLDDSNHPELGRAHIAKIYKSAGEQFEFFSNFSTAKSWLQNMLNSGKETASH